MEVVIFTKVHGHAKSQSPQTLRVLGLSDFASPWTFLQPFLFASSTFYAFSHPIKICFFATSNTKTRGPPQIKGSEGCVSSYRYRVTRYFDFPIKSF